MTAKTQNQRKAEYRKGLKEQGLCEINIVVPENRKPNIKQIAAEMVRVYKVKHKLT